MAVWMSLEVFDAGRSAASWADAHGDAVTEAALGRGALDWSWHRHTWGVIFEVCFADDEAWERFLASVPVQAALDAVPDPLSGVLVYRGRGGSSSRPVPRRPRPFAGAGAVALPLPGDAELLDELPLAGRQLQLRRA